MSLLPYSIIGGLVLTGVSSVITGLIAYDKGKDAERLVWESANVETLIQVNTNLSDILEKKDGEFFLAHKQDIEVGNEIGEQTQEVRTKIVTVSVPEYVKIEVPANCDATDVNINYDTLRLFNSWSEGDSLGQTSGQSTTRDIPLVGAPKVSHEFTEDEFK